MAPPQENIDILFDVKNLFYIGNYQQTINEAQKLKIPAGDDAAKSERDVFLYRAYIAEKKYRVILDEISEGSHPDVKPLKILADYLAHKGRREAIVSMLDEQTSKSANIPNHTFVIVAATIYTHEKMYESALKVLHNDDHIESMAMNVEVALKMDRVDVARKELKAMQEKDEDNTLTQLAQAWLNIAMGGDKLQDAYYIFQELIDKFGPSAVLLNGQVVSFIGQGKYDEAEAALQEAMLKDNNNPDTLINLIVLSQQLAKPIEVVNRYRSQLMDSHGDHQFVTDYQSKEAEFDRLVRQFSVA